MLTIASGISGFKCVSDTIQTSMSLLFKSASSATAARTLFLVLARLHIFVNKNFGTANSETEKEQTKAKKKNSYHSSHRKRVHETYICIHSGLPSECFLCPHLPKFLMQLLVFPVIFNLIKCYFVG